MMYMHLYVLTAFVTRVIHNSILEAHAVLKMKANFSTLRIYIASILPELITIIGIHVSHFVVVSFFMYSIIVISIV